MIFMKTRVMVDDQIIDKQKYFTIGTCISFCSNKMLIPSDFILDDYMYYNVCLASRNVFSFSPYFSIMFSVDMVLLSVLCDGIGLLCNKL